MNEETQDLLTRTCEKYAAAHAKAVSELDEKQFAAVLEQMIKAGDFVKFVRGRGQQIIYLPYHDKQRLEFRLAALSDWQARAVEVLHECAQPMTISYQCNLCDKYYIDGVKFEHANNCELAQLLAEADGGRVE